MRGRRGRGEGSIFRRADGTWVGLLSVGYDQNGKRRRRVVYGTTKAAALEKLAQRDARTRPGNAGVS